MRGHSYYTNDPNANNTDIDKSESIESLLDYVSNDTCYFCVCSTSGYEIACIPRAMLFCNYMRSLRLPNITRDYYTDLFKQDRPSFNTLLSWRMRRTMDNAIYDFIDVLDNGRLGCEVFLGLGLSLLRFFLLHSLQSHLGVVFYVNVLFVCAKLWGVLSHRLLQPILLN